MAATNLTRKLIEAHLTEGAMKAGEEIALRIDQTLTQDATGTLVMLELEAMGLERARTELSAQYVDHNMIQEDSKNPDDHLFLQSAAARFGLWFSRPGNGVSHALHMQRLGRPGATLLGSDSHTCAAGSLGMLAVGAGGLEVALAIAGEPFRLRMPQVMGIRLIGALPDWVSAKDVILEMLRRHTVRGGIGRVLEYYGPGLSTLGAMDRHVIANMGAELGATASVFPSDETIRRFMQAEGRGDAWVELKGDEEAEFDLRDEIDLSRLEPLIARPSSPDNVVAVSEVAGTPIYQCYLGSSANPGWRDFAVPAEILRGRRVHPKVSLDVNPTSRSLLETLIADGHLGDLVRAGARVHQAGCNGCIGMGQAPATGRNSLRTVPRNFPGRSGTKEDSVWLCSPETAAVSALYGVITDPRTEKMPYPRLTAEMEKPVVNAAMYDAPLPLEEASRIQLEKGPNIASLPDLDALPDLLELPVLLKVGDNISTDEIMPAGARVLPYRSNIPKISEFCFNAIDPAYPERALKQKIAGNHAIVAGENYGQGSSREHAALAPRFLGLRVVLARSFARIHRQNLANFGILPLTFADPADYLRIEQGDILILAGLTKTLGDKNEMLMEIVDKPPIIVRHDMTPRETRSMLAGGLLKVAGIAPGPPRSR